jgi:hypothetical protein
MRRFNLHFTADQPFRTARKDVPRDLRIISSGSIDGRSMHESSRKFAAKPRWIVSGDLITPSFDGYGRLFCHEVIRAT